MAGRALRGRPVRLPWNFLTLFNELMVPPPPGCQTRLEFLLQNLCQTRPAGGNGVSMVEITTVINSAGVPESIWIIT